MTDGPRDRREGEHPPAVPPIVRPPAVPPVVPPVAKPVVPPVVPPAKPVVPPVVPAAKPLVPPVVPAAKPVVPPVVSPSARPVPPAVPPVARPVTPPVAPAAARPPVAPVAPPVAKPVPPIAKPVAPIAPPVRPVAPVVPPAAASPPVAPVMKPVAPPAVAPVAAPIARPVAAAPREKEPAGAKRGRDAGKRETVRHGPPPRGGMSLAGKVGLLSFLLTAAVLAAAVLPGRAATGGSGDGAFEATGARAAAAMAAAVDPSALAPRRSSDASEAEKAVRTMVEEVEKDIERNRGNEDEDLVNALRRRREGLIKVLDAVRAPAAGPGGARRLRGLSGSDGGEIVAARVLDAGGRVLAAVDERVDVPGTGKAPAYTSYDATVAGREVRVFEAPILDDTGRSVGRALVAAAPPPARPASGGGALPLVMLILGPILVGGLSYVVASGHARPLRDLARELDKVGSTGDPKRRINAHGPEASAIARSVERMVANLSFRSQHEGSDLEEAIAKEQEAAAEVHQGLMPKTSPRIPGYEVETLFKPGFEIGGDHFEYFQIDERHLGVILLDTSVRGIRAALVMSMARAYVRSKAPGVLSPAALLTEVNALLAVDLSPGQYVTALYAVIDTESGTARVASAGHLPLIVYRHSIGKTAIVNPEGIALGLDGGPVFERSIEEVEVPVGVGDRLVLHTDGALKVQNEVGEEFGEARLYEAVKREAPKNSQAFVNFVGSAIDGFHLTTPQNDDITISTVKRLK